MSRKPSSRRTRKASPSRAENRPRKAGKTARQTRRNDPARTRADILAVATEEFSNHGLSGARVARIAQRTRTSKRMIYYYFGGKEALYRAVLEAAYQGIRETEASLKLEQLDPVAAMRSLVDLTFDYDDRHPDFINLVSIENLHRARYLSRVSGITALNSVVVRRLGDVLKRGQDAGVFRPDVDPVDVHMMISAMCFFRVSNRYTFLAAFQRDFADPQLRAAHKHLIADAILRLLAA